MNNLNSCLKSAKIKLIISLKREMRSLLKPKKSYKSKQNSSPTGNYTKISSKKSQMDSRRSIVLSLFIRILS